MTRPVLHILAGANGAGKSTLYKTQLQPRFPSVEFVNADLLAQLHYGKPATTLEESQTGQRLADERRKALMLTGKDLIAESTFSHPSKLDLVRDAKTRGYEVRLYHVHLRSEELAVKRVARRVNEGGHPVPEKKTRDRYTRNQPLILEAAKLADTAVVFDNSEFGKPARRVLELRQGECIYASQTMPEWARELYSSELQAFTPERLNRAAASFAAARAAAEKILGPETSTYIANLNRSVYAGRIIAETPSHFVQQLGESRAVVAHLKGIVGTSLTVGENYRIRYSARTALITKAEISHKQTAAKVPAKERTRTREGGPKR